MTDIAKWVRQARRGRQSAYRKLYDACVESAWRIAWRVLQRDDLAADCVQDAFVAAFDRLEALADDVAFPAWLNRIAWRKAIDTQRRESRHVGPELSEGDGVLETVTDHLATRRMVDAIDTLDAPFRDVVLLYDLAGCTHPEIAARLEIPVGSSKRRLSVARARLRELLDDVRDDEETTA